MNTSLLVREELSVISRTTKTRPVNLWVLCGGASWAPSTVQSKAKGDKITVNNNYRKLLPQVLKLHYGDMPFFKAKPANPGVRHDSGLVLGGSAEEMGPRLQAMRGRNLEVPVEETFLLAGQRQRWHNFPDEKNREAILGAVSRSLGGVDMDKLTKKSDWLREELQKVEAKPGDWEGSFATEDSIGHLAVLAAFADFIDWKSGPELVRVPADWERTDSAPVREHIITRYGLQDGSHVSVLNARAVARPKGAPRPTSDSQIRELLALDSFGNNPEATIGVSVSPPHIRAVIDIAVRVLQARPEAHIAPPIIHHRYPDTGDLLLRGLGEVPATHKAHERLKALLRGDDPDTAELQNL